MRIISVSYTHLDVYKRQTLDDSANKRLSVPEGFLAIDGILDLCLNVVDVIAGFSASTIT